MQCLQARALEKATASHTTMVLPASEHVGEAKKSTIARKAY